MERALWGIKDERIKPVCEFLLQWSVSRKISLSLKVPWPGYEHSSKMAELAASEAAVL